MSKAIPTISHYMTTSPLTIAADASLYEAHDLIGKHGIRHLPVTDKGRLVGLLSQTDMRLLESFTQTDSRQIAVAAAMSPRPFTVQPTAALDDVLEAMTERKIGSAVVTDNGHIVGIFTSIDAMRATVDLLRNRMRP